MYTFLHVVIKMKILLLFLVWCLLSVVSGNRYLPRDSIGNALCITTTGNISVATVIDLDFVVIH